MNEKISGMGSVIGLYGNSGKPNEVCMNFNCVNPSCSINVKKKKELIYTIIQNQLRNTPIKIPIKTRNRYDSISKSHRNVQKTP